MAPTRQRTILHLLVFVHVALSANVINIIDVQPGEMVSGNVSLRASVTYSIPPTPSGTVPLRVRTTIAGSNYATSVVFVVRAEYENVLKWVMPSSDDSFRSNISLLTAEHTLVPCALSNSSALYIDAFTDSVSPVGYTLFVEQLDLFNLSISELYNTTLTLAQSQIYYFQFPAGVAAITVNAASNDSKTCAFVSIQSTLICPPVDTLYNAIVVGTDQTMTTSAAITITRERLGESSFYLVLIPANPTLCHGSPISDDEGDSYMKQITFSVYQAETLSGHVTEVWAPVLVMLICGALTCLFYFCYITLSLRHSSLKGWAQHVCCEEDPVISGMICYCCIPPKRGNGLEGSGTDNSQGERRWITKEQTGVEGDKYGALAEPSSKVVNMNCSETDPYKDLLQTTESELRLSHFSDERFQAVKVRHAAYIWNTITVGIYYGIPALQVVFAKALSQQMVFPKYEEDESCYYNYQCAVLTFGYIPYALGCIAACNQGVNVVAFNNVLSNSGYVAMGTMFIIIVSIRECYYNKKGCFKNVSLRKGSGIKAGNGLYYAMGFALIGEGVMSALYHVCPSDINFQFDTTFMFIIGGLVIAKLLQNRHPYFNANSFCAFWGFSVVTLSTMIGLYFDRSSPVAIRVVLLFVLLGIAGVFYFSLYHFNQLTVMCNPKMWKLRKSRLVKLLCAIGCDGIVIAVLFFYSRLDIATTILALFALNGVVLLAWYFGSKCFHSEPRIALPAMIFILAMGLWFVAGTYFQMKIYNSAATPAESRELNKPCYIGGFYDYHDFWHFMSAAAIFTTFMGMLTLDDGLKMNEHCYIHVF